MALQDVTDSLITDREAEVRQRTNDTIIAPGAVLLGHAHHQRLKLRVNGGASWGLALLGAVTLLGHELPVPAKNRVGLHDCGHILEGLLAQLLANLGQRLAFAIRQPHPARDLVAQDAIFGDEVLIAQ